MPTALAISPHLDDAVFSAGGTLTRLARDGWRVVVATVFTASVADPEGFALACQLDKGLAADIDYMAVRRSEDAAACRVMGAEPIWLPFREAPHRGYASAGALFAHPRPDDDIVEPVSSAIVELIKKLQPDLVLGPQAVGAHVDHVAVFRALARCGPSADLWVDFPYASRPAHRPSPFGADIALLPQQRISLSDRESELKAEATLAYKSQLAFQFGGSASAQVAVLFTGQVESFALGSGREILRQPERR